MPSCAYWEYDDEPVFQYVYQGKHSSSPIILDYTKVFGGKLSIDYLSSEMSVNQLNPEDWGIFGGLDSDYEEDYSVRLAWKPDSEDPTYFYLGYVVDGPGENEDKKDYLYYFNWDDSPEDVKIRVKAGDSFHGLVRAHPSHLGVEISYQGKEGGVKIEHDFVKRRGFTPIFDPSFHETIPSPTDITFSGLFRDTKWSY